MANENGIRDENNVVVVLWVNSTDDSETLPLEVDPATGAIMCEL